MIWLFLLTKSWTQSSNWIVEAYHQAHHAHHGIYPRNHNGHSLHCHSFIQCQSINRHKRHKKKKFLNTIPTKQYTILSSTWNNQNENQTSIYNAETREKVKTLTSDIIDPIAIDEEALGEYCLFMTGEEECLDEMNGNTFHFSSSLDHNNESEIIWELYITEIVNKILTFIPLIAPVIAFLTYKEVAYVFNYILETVSANNWQPVDGRAFQTQTITPAINGIVVPAISILFATLSGTTISTLRQRQLDIRTCLNMEANEIRVLQAMVDSFPTTSTSTSTSSSTTSNSGINGSTGIQMDGQDKCRNYLFQYTSRLIQESQPGAVLSKLEFRGSMDNEMNGFIVQLNEIAVSSSSSSAPNPMILSESYGTITRLNSFRSTRISALQSTFPMLHFFILVVSGGSICLTFLMETNQEILLFLNAVQLRMLWTILIGIMSALGVVCYDLCDPFRGSYQIASSIDQLYTIREVIRASDRLKKYKQMQKSYLENKPLPRK